MNSHLFVYFYGLVTLKQYSTGGEGAASTTNINTSSGNASKFFENSSRFIGSSISRLESTIKQAQGKIKTRIFLENFCENVYSPKDAEELLDIDSKFGQEWWRPLNFPLAPKIPNPLCSPYPNLMRGTTVTLNSHEFFRQKDIHIPSSTGVKDTRLHYFRFQTSKTPIWREFLDCHCYSYSGDALCKNGKMSVSRGVGGDTSFFIHQSNDQGEDSVVAHICFPQENFKPPAACRTLCRYVGAGTKRAIPMVQKLRPKRNTESKSSEQQLTSNTETKSSEQKLH